MYACIAYYTLIVCEHYYLASAIYIITTTLQSSYFDRFHPHLLATLLCIL